MQKSPDFHRVNEQDFKKHAFIIIKLYIKVSLYTSIGTEVIAICNRGTDLDSSSGGKWAVTKGWDHFRRKVAGTCGLPKITSLIAARASRAYEAKRECWGVERHTRHRALFLRLLGRVLHWLFVFASLNKTEKCSKQCDVCSVSPRFSLSEVAAEEKQKLFTCSSSVTEQFRFALLFCWFSVSDHTNIPEACRGKWNACVD